MTTHRKESGVAVRAGDDTPRWLLRGQGVDVAQCLCRHAVYEDGNAAPILGPLSVSATVEDGGEDWFALHLTPAQTAALNTGRDERSLVWVAELIGTEDVEPPYNREVHRDLIVLPQKLPA